MKNKLLFLIMFSCSNPILKIVDEPKKQEPKYFEASYHGKEFDILLNNDTINREKIIIVIRNLSKDTIFYECYNDSTINRFGYARTIYDKLKQCNIWGYSYSSNSIGDDNDKLLNVKLSHILPNKQKKIRFLKYEFNNTSDSAGVGFDFVIKNKPHGEFIYFKNK